MTHEIIEQLKNIHYQATMPASILLSLRSRIEKNRGVSNRLGSVFPNGCKGVLLAGKAGSGKTNLMRAVFDGLGLDTVNSQGRTVGKWFSSAGSSTAVGLLEVLKIYSDSIVFLDELGIDTTAHLHVIKQIANGEILHQKFDSIEPVPFNGMVIAATNGIRVPRGNDLEHLLALLDRFIVARMNPPRITPNGYLDQVLGENKIQQVKWSVIGKALSNKNVADLNDNEKTLLRNVWEEKSLEILDPTRSQFRNCHYAKDIFTFTKRILDIPDITKDKEAEQFARDMIADTIIFNPVNILWLNPLEDKIYTTISGKEEASLQEIVNACDSAGISVSVKHIHSIINSLIRNLIIYRSKHGMYSISKKAAQENKNKKTEALTEEL